MIAALRRNKRFQNAVALLHAPADRAALARLRDAYRGRTLFLVGGGPSLRQMDIGQLPARGALFMTVNNGFRLFPNTPIPMHAVSDIACYERFGEEIERAEIKQRFYRSRFRATANYQKFGHPHDTVFAPYRKGGVLKAGFQPRAELGLGNDSSVLIFAAQIGYHLGFSTIHVLGCDLDYSTPAPYAYAVTDADRAHETSAVVQSVRRAMVNANAEFAALRAAFEADGRRLINCGVGGKLEALARIPFEQALREG